MLSEKSAVQRLKESALFFEREFEATVKLLNITAAWARRWKATARRYRDTAAVTYGMLLAARERHEAAYAVVEAARRVAADRKLSLGMTTDECDLCDALHAYDTARKKVDLDQTEKQKTSSLSFLRWKS